MLFLAKNDRQNSLFIMFYTTKLFVHQITANLINKLICVLKMSNKAKFSANKKENPSQDPLFYIF
jgi:hypothetical protein